MSKNTKNAVMVLQEFTVKKGLRPPEFEIYSSISGTHENRFDYKVSVAGITALGTGCSKQISKHQAAQNALLALKEEGLFDPSENPVTAFSVPLIQKGPPDSPFKSSVNCVGPLKDLCVENKIPYPIFTEISNVGPPHAKEFTYECKIASIKTQAIANTKKMAKQLAAQEMVERLQEVLPELIAQTNIDTRALPETEKILKKYNEFAEKIIEDKTVKVSEFPNTLKKLMMSREKEFQDFAEDLKTRTEESLKKILDVLELSYDIMPLQEGPSIVSLSLSTDTPFTTLGVGATELEATEDALQKAFEIMELFMQIKLDEPMDI